MRWLIKKMLKDKTGKIEASLILLTPQLRLPDSDMRNGLEVFIIGSNINEVKVIHSKQMKGIIGKQAKTLQLRQVFNNDMLGRFYNAYGFSAK